jgi:acetyl esterase/lipase
MLIGALLTLAVAACDVPARHYADLAKGGLTGVGFRAEYAGAVKDVPYLPGDNDAQRLDIYKSGRHGLSPVVVFIHGGAWKSGTRRLYGALGETLSNDGVMTVNVDYRLYPEVTYPAFMEDAVAALNWVMGHIAEYGGDPERVFLTGHSAGAHIAALMVLNDRFRQQLSFDVRRLRGVVLFAGAYEFRPTEPTIGGAHVQRVMGTPENYLDAQPRQHARADVPPILVINGDADVVTREAQAARFAAAMQAAGASLQYAKLRGGDHLSVLIDMMPGRKGPAYWLFMDFVRDRLAQD